MTLAVALANQGYRAFALPATRRFERALRDPAPAQRATLSRILEENATSTFGRAHGFARIRSVAEFRESVPPRDYNAYAGDVDRIAAGTPGVLTQDPVRFFEPTSGSSGASKLVPYTTGLLREFSAATVPWISDLLQHRPALRRGRAYWAISPPARRDARTAAGIPIGLEHDSDYFPPFVGALLDLVLSTPRELSRAPDIATCRYLTLRSLLAVPDLALVSVWSPSFLTLLASSLDEEFPRLLHDLERGTLSTSLDGELRATLMGAFPADPARAAALRRRFGRRAPDDLGALWDQLRVISCWTDGYAARAVASMQARFPKVEVQGKGLLATEGVVSIPWIAAEGSVAAVASHFLEFATPGSSEFLGVHELTSGSMYEVFLTTSGGFYRYRLKDLVRVEGWHHATPLLSFRGRVDRACDIAGEKLTPQFAERALDDALARSGAGPVGFAMLAPAWREPPHYGLYIECDAGTAERVATELERQLRASHHYDLCRALGQLDAVRAVPVLHGAATYERVCVARGQRAGAIKPASLDEHDGWEQEFVPGLQSTMTT
ncbi:MAG: GH3 auxin-responsive promoter family protein [Cytophagaceae bacterium]|nr:GH3 auxin-responsive promoter family protein [Gemmatimonadaceae bacterium]